MTQILAIGDLHFRVDNLQPSEQLLQQVESWLKHHTVNFIVILGDVLHSHEKVFTFAMNMAVKFIRMCATYAVTYVMVGNHDATSNTFYCGDNHWMNVLRELPYVVVVDKPTYLTNTKVMCCPYVSNGRFVEALNEFAGEGWNTSPLIFAHQLLDGAKMGGIVSTGVEKWPLDYPMVISGHLHERQQPQGNLYYTGSSQQTTFAEQDDKSIVVVSVANEATASTEGGTSTSGGSGAVKIREIFLTLQQRKTVYMSVAEVQHFNFANISSTSEVKVVIKDDDAAIKAFKKSLKYKQMEQLPQVKAVQFKPAVASTMPHTSTEPKEFAELLLQRLEQQDDPYLVSYGKHLLNPHEEDCSDKAVVLM